MGRHSEFNWITAEYICDELAGRNSGTPHSLDAICKEDRGKSGTPSISTVMKWLNQVPDFAASYVCAREEQAEAYAAEIVAISDDSGADARIEYDAQGRPHAVIDGEAIQRAKLRVEARKWVASKLKPGTYGDRQYVEHSGTVNLQTAGYDELLAEVQRLVGKGILPALPAPVDAEFTVVLDSPEDDDLAPAIDYDASDIL